MTPILHYYNMATGVVAFSTTRRGGCSTGQYAEFNINRYCGDDPQHIVDNRKSLCQLLGISDARLLMPHQTHETRVARIDEDFLALTSDERQARLEGTDAVMTDVPCVCIGVSTADCIPILLYDPRHRASCAVHAGWRGTVSRIAEKAVTAMKEAYGTQPSDLTAQIGPGISLDSFEVGQEVYDLFVEEFGVSIPATQKEEYSEESPQRGRVKPHIDLPECNRRQLIASGLNPDNIALCGICTFKQYDTFFSARRIGIQSGRIFTGIVIK